MKTVLILAAGMGSRYKGSKQTDRFGPNGETLLEYSIRDAIDAGFTKLVFIVREEIKEVVKNIFEPLFQDKALLFFVCQPINTGAVNRSKPWGTTHAVLCAKAVIHEPFIVINADDFYGAEAYQKAFDFLEKTAPSENLCALISYSVSATLSEFGQVSRGVCHFDSQFHLISISERKVFNTEEGVVYLSENGGKVIIPDNTPVSMNFWCFFPFVLPLMGDIFEKFVLNNQENPTSELPIPPVIDRLIAAKKLSISLIPTQSEWFGVTYPEDKPGVMKKMSRLAEMKK